MLPHASTPGADEAHSPAASGLRVLSVAHGGVLHGVGRRRYEALSGQAGLELTLVVPERWREYGVTYRAEPQSGDIKVIAAPARWLAAGPAKWYLHHYKSLGRILREVRPDVIHLWEEPWSVVALQALRLRDRLLPDAALVLETDQNILRRLPPPFEQIRRLTLKHTDLLITRQAEAEAVSRACGFTGPARCVGYGVDPAIFHPNPASRGRRVGDGLTTGYVGRIVRDKGIFDILDALVAGPENVRFTAVGTGPDRAAFEARAHALGISNRVRVIDPQPPGQIAEFMRGLDALLLMSRTTGTWKEQFGRVIIEAQACGTPVIGSASGAIPEVVGEGGWILPEGDPAALAGLLTRLSHDRANQDATERDRVAGLGLANVVTRYTYERVGEQLLDVYRTAAASRVTSRSASLPSLASRPTASSSDSLSAPRVIAVHETDGRKYLEALEVLARDGQITSVSFHGASVLWRFAHAMLRDRMRLRQALGIAFDNLRFQLRLGSLQDATVIIAVAPWDFRLPWLVWRLRCNRIIYNTSWPWWIGDHVPRPYGVFTPLIRRAFRAALCKPGVSVVTVTSAAARSLALFLPGVQPTVISHVVSDSFFARRACHRTPFRLLFVGELSEKKGFRDFLALCESFADTIEVEVVGDGPLRALAERAAQRIGWTWRGKVGDRERLADIVAQCQALISLPHRSSGWEELFGMAVAEAMAAGVPCIVHDHIGPSEIIRHGQDGFLVAEGDTDAVRGWIRLLRDEPERWQAVADAAAEAARRYAMTSVSRQWRDVLTKPAVSLHGPCGAKHHAPCPASPEGSLPWMRPKLQRAAHSC